MYFINNIFLFPFSGGCTGATYLYFWKPPQKLPAGRRPHRFLQHVHQTFVLFPNIDSSLGGLSFGKDGDGNYGYYGADGSLIPFKSGKLIFAAKFAYSTKDDGNTCYSFSVDGINKILITGIALRSGTGLYVVPNNNITTDTSTTPSISDSIATVISTTPLEVDVSNYDYITLMYYGSDQYITFKVEAL